MTETRVLVQCDGAAVPEELADQTWSYQRPINSRGASTDLNLRAQSLASTVLTNIESRAADLVRIASYVYAADQMISRGGDADVYGRKWRRHFALCMPVSDPAFWMQDEVRSSLSTVLLFLTEDYWEFHFSKAPEQTRQLPLDVKDNDVLGTPDTVVLFSGGADSLCTAIEAVVDRGQRPVLVSHRPAPNLNARQGKLTELLRNRFPGWEFPHLSFWIHRKGSDAADTSQRSRAFLFACIGAAVAAELDISQVLLGDNGIVSLNLPTSAQLVGALASRSTHPKFIHHFNELLTHIFPQQLELSNSEHGWRGVVLHISPASRLHLAHRYGTRADGTRASQLTQTPCLERPRCHFNHGGPAQPRTGSRSHTNEQPAPTRSRTFWPIVNAFRKRSKYLSTRWAAMDGCIPRSYKEL